MYLAKKDYPKWAKATAGVSVLSRSGALGKQVEMRMGMFGIEVKSVFEYTYSNPGGGAQMEWKSVAGTIKVCLVCTAACRTLLGPGRCTAHGLGPIQTQC